MSLYAEQHSKKMQSDGQQQQKIDAGQSDAFRRTNDKENMRFRRSSRPSLPIGSASKRSSGTSAAEGSPAPCVPLALPVFGAGGSMSSRGGQNKAVRGDPASASASRTPSTLQGQCSTQASLESAPVVQQEAVAELLTRASEALKLERARSSALAAEKEKLLDGLQRLCDCYMSLESSLAACEQRCEGSPNMADNASLGRQVRELAERFRLNVPAPQRRTPRGMTSSPAPPSSAVAISQTSTPRQDAPREASARRLASTTRAQTPGQASQQPLVAAERRTRSLPRTRSASASAAGRGSASADAYDGTVAVFSAARGAAAQEAMASRLRRALAPQPTREQVGDIIDAMVQAIQKDPARVIPAAGVPGGPRFQLTRVSACTYRLRVGSAAALLAHAEASAKARAVDGGRPADTQRVGGGVHESLVHLVINSGSLRVVRGGGPVDFFDFMDRKLRLMQRPA